jgi:hypothetical protein
LIFSIEPSKPSYASGEPIELIARIENHESELPWVFLPLIVPDTGESWPDLQLSVEVFDATGRKLRPHTLTAPVVKRVVPSPCDFLSLQPRALFGKRVSLSSGPFAYAFDDKGRYRIEARLRSAGRAWLQEMIRIGRLREADLPFALERVPQGLFESTPVAIEIR